MAPLNTKLAIMVKDLYSYDPNVIPEYAFQLITPTTFSPFGEISQPSGPLGLSTPDRVFLYVLALKKSRKLR